MVRRRARSASLLHDHGGPADREPLDSFGERGKAGALTVAGHGDHLGLDVVAHGVQIDHVITVLKRQSFGPDDGHPVFNRPCHGRGRRGRGRLPARHVERRLPRVFIICTGDLGDRDEQTRGDDTSEPTGYGQKGESGRHD